MKKLNYILVFVILVMLAVSCHKNSIVEEIVTKNNIYYKDFDPDLVITPINNVGYPVEINADTVPDMTIHYKYLQYNPGHLSEITKYWIESHDSLVFIKTPKYSYWFSCDCPLAQGTIINDTCDTTTSIILFYWDSGLWVYDNSFHSPGFVGLKFKNGDNWYYGWLRLSSAPVTLYDLAIYEIPNTPIAMGQH